MSADSVGGTHRAPEVSVVIPTRNRAHLLPRALQSALGQEDVELEVIVVDDGSSDGTQRLLRSIGDPRVATVTHEVRRGLPQARNSGIARARGSWLAFLDDDDVWAPQKLRTQLDTAFTARASFAYSSAVLVDEDGQAHYAYPVPDPLELLSLLLARNVMPAGSSNVVAKTEVVRALGGFDETLPGLADWDLWIRLASSTEGAACSEILVGCLQHRSNMSGARGRAALGELQLVARKHRKLAASTGVRPDRSRVRRWIADERRRRVVASAEELRQSNHRLRAAGIYLRSAVAFRRLDDARQAVATVAVRAPGVAAVPKRIESPSWLRLYRWS